MKKFNKIASIFFIILCVVFILFILAVCILLPYKESKVYVFPNDDYNLEVRVNEKRDGYVVHYHSLEDSMTLCEVSFENTKFYPSDFEYVEIVEEKNLLGEVRYKLIIFFIVGDEDEN